jgi:hypothetical protein
MNSNHFQGVGGLRSLLATSDTAGRQHVYRAADVHLRITAVRNARRSRHRYL